MAKIVFVADAHLGRRYDFRRDPVTGISERALDFLKALERAVQHAIEIDAEIFVVAGDFYDNPRVGPTMRKLVAERALQPLNDAELSLIIVGGNHDSPRSLAKGAAYGDIAFLRKAHISRTLDRVEISLKDGSQVGFVLLPYLTPSQIIGMIETLTGQEIPREDWLLVSQRAIRDAVHHEVKELNTDIKILVGHFYVSGSRLRETKHPEVLIGKEFEFRKDMLPLEQLDLAVFGHVHLHQSLANGKIVIPGALERVNFDERDDDKGFLVFDTIEKTWEFISSKPRPLVKTAIALTEEVKPRKAILSAVQKETPNLSDAIVRLEVESSLATRERANERTIRELLIKQGAFHVEIRWDHLPMITTDVVGADMTLDPLSLFHEYCVTVESIHGHPLYNRIQALGEEFLQKRLEEKD